MIEDGLISPPYVEREECPKCKGAGELYYLATMRDPEHERRCTPTEWENAPEWDLAHDEDEEYRSYSEPCPMCHGDGMVDVNNEPPEFDYDDWKDEQGARLCEQGLL